MAQVQLDPSVLRAEAELFRKNYPEALPNIENMMIGIISLAGIQEASEAKAVFLSLQMLWNMSYMQGRLANQPPNHPVFRDQPLLRSDEGTRDGGQPNRMSRG